MKTFLQLSIIVFIPVFIFSCKKDSEEPAEPETEDNGTWEELISTGPPARYGHTMTRIGNKIYLFGGTDEIDKSKGTFAQLNDLWSYDEDNDEWQEEVPQNIPSKPIPGERHGHVTAALDDILYMFSGTLGNFEPNDLWSYNTITKIWTAVDAPGNWPPGRTGGSMIALNDRLWIFGGRTGSIILNDLWYYNPESNSWILQTSSGIKARTGHGMVAVDGKIYVYGGMDGEKPINDFMVYNPFNGLWENIQVPDAGITPRSDFAMVAVSDGFIVAGGKDMDGNVLRETWTYNVKTGNWSKKTDCPPVAEWAGAPLEETVSEGIRSLFFGGKLYQENIAAVDRQWIYMQRFFGHGDLELNPELNIGQNIVPNPDRD